MSLLIKALKQAERDHQARTSGANEPAPAQANSAEPGIALELDPLEAIGTKPPQENYPSLSIELEEPASESAQADVPTAPHGTPPAFEPSTPVPTTLAETPAPSTETRTLEPAAAPAAATLATSPAAALFASVRAAAAASLQTDRGGAPSAPLASAGPAAQPLPGSGIKPAQSTTPADDGGTQLRRAARHLMAPDPDRLRGPRLRILVGTLAGLALGAIGYLLWQTGGPNYWTSTTGSGRLRLSATAPLATAAQTPAPAASGPSQDTPTKTKLVPHASAPSVAGGESPNKQAPAPVLLTARATGEASGSALANAPQTDSGASAAAIRLRPLELNSEKIRALLQDAYSAEARGDALAAKKGYERVLEVDANNGDAWVGLAGLAANSGDANGASQYYRRALEIDPSDSVALAGYLGLQTGIQAQDYEARLRQFIARDGMQPVLLSALGRLLGREGRWLEAQEIFFQAWSADPTQPDIAFNLAVSLERIHQSEAAVTYYQRALQLARDHGSHFDQKLANERIAALLVSAAPAAGANARGDEKAPAAWRK